MSLCKTWHQESSHTQTISYAVGNRGVSRALRDQAANTHACNSLVAADLAHRVYKQQAIMLDGSKMEARQSEWGHQGPARIHCALCRLSLSLSLSLVCVFEGEERNCSSLTCWFAFVSACTYTVASQLLMLLMVYIVAKCLFVFFGCACAHTNALVTVLHARMVHMFSL